MRHGENRLLGLLLDALPTRSTQLVEIGVLAITANVLLHEVHSIDREIETIPPLVFEKQEIALVTGHGQMGEPVVATDSVVEVDDEVVGLELLETAHHLVEGKGDRLPPARASMLPEEVQLRYANESVVREMNRSRELPLDDEDTSLVPLDERRWQRFADDRHDQVLRLENVA